MHGSVNTKLPNQEMMVKNVIVLAIYAVMGIIFLIMILAPELLPSIKGVSGVQWSVRGMAVLALVSILLSQGWKETVNIIIVWVIITPVWYYVLYLYMTLSGQESKPLLPTIGMTSKVPHVYLVALLLYVLFRYVLPESLRQFFSSIWRIVSVPGIWQALAHLLVSFVTLAIIFAIVYASIYINLGPTSFKSDHQLELFDFIYYSLFIPISIGYPDIVPVHWLPRVVTLIELMLGLGIIVLYLGVIVGRLSDLEGKDIQQ
jgi:Ion channel